MPNDGKGFSDIGTSFEKPIQHIFSCYQKVSNEASYGNKKEGSSKSLIIYLFDSIFFTLSCYNQQ